MKPRDEIGKGWDKSYVRESLQGGENDEILLPWTAPAVFEGAAGTLSVDQEAVRFEPTARGPGDWRIPLTGIRGVTLLPMAGAGALMMELETRSGPRRVEFVGTEDRVTAFVMIPMMANARLDPVRTELSNRTSGLRPSQFEELLALLFGRGWECSIRFIPWRGGRDIELTDPGRPAGEFHVRVGACHVRAGSSPDPGEVTALRDRAAGTAPNLLMMTNGKFSDAAVKAASEPGQQSVELLDGEAIFDDMIHRRLGVGEGADGTLEIDDQFWGQF